jgi:hypothetical protein
MLRALETGIKSLIMLVSATSWRWLETEGR